MLTIVQIELHIELDADAQPISGRLRLGAHRTSTLFVGWVELVHAIERARATGVPPECQGADPDSEPSPSP